MFFNEEVLLQIEEKEQWPKAIKWLKTQNEHCCNMISLLHYIGEIWYVLMLWDCCISHEGLEYGDLTGRLKHEIAHNIVKIRNNAIIEAYIGYMIWITPHLLIGFTKGADSYEDCSRIGIKMMADARMKAPNNIIVQILTSSSPDLERKKYAHDLHTLHFGQSALGVYFRDIIIGK